ncbi:uncharacterized protein LTR77_004841 [Saxophila tyrrhenica]|uniref:Uncharacterized protein n=1 Tax=Saxophila tyrrhenica TaxID=1690608 RepID=A0AAV9PDE8_9PEZI|nr:hypothetical protein LTR77_004841 [Saxophila tyrrhenica]
MHHHLLPSLLAASLIFAQASRATAARVRRDNGFEVTRPKAGDTIVLPEYSFDDKLIPIRWTVPDELKDRPVIVALVSGSNPDNLTTIETAASDARNNGTLDWMADISSDAPSACNYSIYLKVWTDFAYSGYFTIINPDDGGIDTDSRCPVDHGLQRPANGSYMSTGNDAQETSSNDDEQPNADTTSESTGGVTTTTVTVAVAVPIVVLLLLVAAGLYIGVRKGWFVRKADRDALSRYQNGYAGDVSLRAKDGVGIEAREREGLGELNGQSRPHLLNSTEVYQLHGDEGRRY